MYFITSGLFVEEDKLDIERWIKRPFYKNHKSGGARPRKQLLALVLCQNRPMQPVCCDGVQLLHLPTYTNSGTTEGMTDHSICSEINNTF